LLCIGLISGTSADGVDAALCELGDAGGGRLALTVRAWLTVPYERGIRAAVLRAASDQATTSELSKLNAVLGEVFAGAAAQVCARAGVDLGSVDLIGSHGQTVWHDPFPSGGGVWRTASTLQLAQPQTIAERTGVTVVADFRPRDMAAGGQGAPLVPLVDYLTLGDPERGRIALNLGGIANITVLPAGAGADRVTGFDTGPGNMVVDWLAASLTDGAQACDADGAMAAAGGVDGPLLQAWLQHPYFLKPPPKSTGREVFGPRYAGDCLAAARSAGLSPEDAVATATALTAETVADAVRRFVLPSGGFEEVVASGGGVHNPTLMATLRRRLQALGLKLVSAEEYGLPVDGKEAVAFAVLAYLTFRGRPGNIPGVTGARRPVVLGVAAPGITGVWLAAERRQPGGAGHSPADDLRPASVGREK
jgi:anhydro-N-acetylmuramic acid kinase